MNIKSRTMLLIAFMITLVFSSTAFAFEDVADYAEFDKIMQLKASQVIQGKSDSIFAPDEMMTGAEAVQLLVRGFELSLAHIQFIRAPQASDYYDHVPDDAWYADAFIIAHHNGIEIPRDIQPNEPLTKEVYAHLLYQAMLTKADFALIKIWNVIADEEDVTAEYMSSIQALIILKLLTLDEEQNLNPQNPVSRYDGAIMLFEALVTVEEKGIIPDDDDSLPYQPGIDNVTFHTQKVNDDINKVILDWGEQPHPGYGISIQSIQFDHANQTAIIYYQLHYPDPDMMYPQVIVNPTAETYVSSEYTVEIKITSESLNSGKL